MIKTVGGKSRWTGPLMEEKIAKFQYRSLSLHLFLSLSLYFYILERAGDFPSAIPKRIKGRKFQTVFPLSRCFI